MSEYFLFELSSYSATSQVLSCLLFHDIVFLHTTFLYHLYFCCPMFNNVITEMSSGS